MSTSKSKGHGEQELDQDISDLGGPMIRRRLRRVKETLQHRLILPKLDQL